MPLLSSTTPLTKQRHTPTQRSHTPYLATPHPYLCSYATPLSSCATAFTLKNRPQITAEITLYYAVLTHPEILDDVSEGQVLAQHLVDLVDQARVHLAHLLRGHL